MFIARALIAAALIPGTAMAQFGRETRPATIVVSATGSVQSPPDRATLSLSIRGEGKTADAATTMLAARQKAILAGLRSLDARVEIQTGAVSIREVYAGTCDDTRFQMGSDDDIADNMATMAESLSLAADVIDGPSAAPKGKKDCTLVGRAAEIRATIIMHSVKDAGTAIGLAGRLGASTARIDDFSLSDDSDASNRAIAKAIQTARAKAQAIATASGAKLGAVISVDDGSERATNLASADMAMQVPAVMAPPPIVVAVSPKPVETDARLTVTFAIER